MEYLSKLTKLMVARLRKKYTGIAYQTIEDVVQDGLLKYLEAFGNLDNISENWLWVVCNRRLIDIWRHEKFSVPGAPEQICLADGQSLVDIAVDSKREAIKTAAESLAYPDQN